MSRGRKNSSTRLPVVGGAPAAPEPRPNWLWFRATAGGRRKAHEEFLALAEAGQAGLSVRIARILAGESRAKDVASLGDGLFEVRDRVGSNHYRVIFMRWGRHYVALTAFYKNQQQTPKQDLDRARLRARTWSDTFGAKPEG